MMSYTRQEISEATGFDMGDEFDSLGEVVAYFQRDALRACVNAPTVADELPDQATLDLMVHWVIVHRWHCRF